MRQTNLATAFDRHLPTQIEPTTIKTQSRCSQTPNWAASTSKDGSALQGLQPRREKLVTNSSPKLGHFGAFLGLVRTGKARQAKGFSFLTSRLTR